MESLTKINIPNYVLKIIDKLEKSGYEAFCVGGCVRDSLLLMQPYDWDIATSATPSEILGVFRNYKTIDVGIKHGTITVISDFPVEITTYRIDGIYTDARHPETVNFSTSLKDDLARRDFTINAIAYNPKVGIIDFYGGLSDLSFGIIRCVGEPMQRFSEDALRIMRCIRFASQLGFQIDKNTSLAAMENKHLLASISAERINVELSKLLCGDFASEVLKDNSEIIFEIIPELRNTKDCKQENDYHIYDVWEHTLAAINASPRDLITRLSLLFHDSGKPEVKTMDNGISHFYNHATRSAEIATKALERLRYPKKVIANVVELIRLHDQILPLSDKRIKKFLVNLKEETFFRLLDIVKADVSAQAPYVALERVKLVNEADLRARDLLCSGLPLSVADLEINGNDLIALGFSKNELLGETLDSLFELVLYGQVPNDKQRLLKIAKGRLSKQKL